MPWSVASRGKTIYVVCPRRQVFLWPCRALQLQNHRKAGAAASGGRRWQIREAAAARQPVAEARRYFLNFRFFEGEISAVRKAMNLVRNFTRKMDTELSTSGRTKGTNELFDGKVFRSNRSWRKKGNYRESCLEDVNKGCSSPGVRRFWRLRVFIRFHLDWYLRKWNRGLTKAAMSSSEIRDFWYFLLKSANLPVLFNDS